MTNDAAERLRHLLTKYMDGDPQYRAAVDALDQALAEARAAERRATVDLLREVVAGWEPGPGPFVVPMPTVNKIINFLRRKGRAR